MKEGVSGRFPASGFSLRETPFDDRAFRFAAARGLMCFVSFPVVGQVVFLRELLLLSGPKIKTPEPRSARREAAKAPRSIVSY